MVYLTLKLSTVPGLGLALGLGLRGVACRMARVILVRPIGISLFVMLSLSLTLSGERASTAIVLNNVVI